eukprot:scpid103588/ scgid16718/ 
MSCVLRNTCSVSWKFGAFYLCSGMISFKLCTCSLSAGQCAEAAVLQSCTVHVVLLTDGLFSFTAVVTWHHSALTHFQQMHSNSTDPRVHRLSDGTLEQMLFSGPHFSAGT